MGVLSQPSFRLLRVGSELVIRTHPQNMSDSVYSNEEMLIPVAASGITVATIWENVEEKSM